MLTQSWRQIYFNAISLAAAATRVSPAASMPLERPATSLGPSTMSLVTCCRNKMTVTAVNESVSMTPSSWARHSPWVPRHALLGAS